jgi:hypothetical protein
MYELITIMNNFEDNIEDSEVIPEEETEAVTVPEDKSSDFEPEPVARHSHRQATISALDKERLRQLFRKTNAYKWLGLDKKHNLQLLLNSKFSRTLTVIKSIAVGIV